MNAERPIGSRFTSKSILIPPIISYGLNLDKRMLHKTLYLVGNSCTSRQLTAMCLITLLTNRYKTPTCFSLSRPSSGSFVLPYFEVANACMLNIYGTAAACVWLCRLCLCSFADVRPVLIVSVPCLCVQ